MMDLNIATLDAVEQLPTRLALTQERIEIMVESGTATCQQDGWARIRVLGAGGFSNGGSEPGPGGACGLKTVRVQKGDRFVCVIGAGADLSSSGGVTTVTGPGVAISVPASGGAPTGLDYYQMPVGGLPALVYGMRVVPPVPAESLHGSSYGRFGPTLQIPAESNMMGLPLPTILSVGAAGRQVRALGGIGPTFGPQNPSANQGRSFGEGARSDGNGSSGPGLVVFQWMEVFA